MKVDKDTADRLISAFNAASVAVKKSLPMKQGGSGAETQYTEAYQALVRAGLAPQIRQKYR